MSQPTKRKRVTINQIILAIPTLLQFSVSNPAEDQFLIRLQRAVGIPYNPCIYCTFISPDLKIRTVQLLLKVRTVRTYHYSV